MVSLNLNHLPVGDWRATSAMLLDWWSPLVVITLVSQDGAYTQNVRLDLGKRALLDHVTPDVASTDLVDLVSKLSEHVRLQRARSA